MVQNDDLTENAKDVEGRPEEEPLREEQESVDNCPGCHIHCPTDDLQCGRGRHIQAERAAGAGPAERGGCPPYEGGSGHRPHREGGRWHRREGFGPEEGPCDGGHPRGFGRPPRDISARERLPRMFSHASHLLMHRKGSNGGRNGVLGILASHGDEMSQRIIAEKLDVRPASLSELLGKMEASGLVTRETSEADRRAVIVRLTEAGKEEARVAMAQRAETDKALFSALSDEECEHLVALLERLLEDWHRGSEQGRRGGHRGPVGRGRHGGHGGHGDRKGFGGPGDHGPHDGRGSRHDHDPRDYGHHGHGHDGGCGHWGEGRHPQGRYPQGDHGPQGGRPQGGRPQGGHGPQGARGPQGGHGPQGRHPQGGHGSHEGRA